MNPLAAKVSRPRLPQTLVHRQRLINVLDAGTGRPVTLLSAGAGWGKTVLVASWAEKGSPPGPVAWLTLDAEDNDPNVFWSHVLAAIREVTAVPDADHPAELRPISAVDQPIAERVLQCLAQMPGPLVLVIDDLQEVEDSRLMKDLTGLLRYPPDQLRMVLITRTEPLLPLHRARVDGRLTEIRASDLEFTVDEAAELLSRHDLQLTGDDLATLLERTEGWAAGLQLAVSFLSARGNGNGIDSFDGDVRAVAEYLAREVLANLPADVRDFLLYTSVPDRLCGELADAMTGNTHGQRVLERLERDNAFVVGFGSQPRWFRYHHLLRDVLQHELQVQAPTMVPELQRRAARWYAGHDATIKALQHAAAGQDWRFVGRLVAARAAPLIVTAERTALANVLRQIPPDELVVTPELMLCAALQAFHAGDYDAIPYWITKARDLLTDQTDVERLPIEITLRALDLAVRRVRGDMPALVAAATDILRRLTEMRFVRSPSVPQYRAIALNNKGVGLLWGGEPDLAERYLWAALTAAKAAGVELVEINAVGHLALLAYMKGSLQEAYEHATGGRELADRRGWNLSIQATAAHLALVLIELERNNIPEAERALKRGLSAFRSGPEAAQWAVLCFARARLSMAKGELDAARAALLQAQQGAERRISPTLDRWLLLAESEVDLASGRPQEVQARYAQLADEGLTPPETVRLARAALALGDPDRADALLVRPRASSSDIVAAVEAHVVSALVADAQRHGNRSVDALAEAFALAEPVGVRRPFLSVGSRRLTALVERQRWLIRENTGFVSDVLAEMQSEVETPVPHGTSGDLSDREMEVLRYLPTVLSASEIGDELHVSVNTVKAHMRSIYRKLGAARRRDAVVRARGLGIL